MNAIQIILDILMIAIIVCIISVTVKKGFIRSFFKSARILIVILITALIGTCLSGVFSDMFVADMFEGRVSEVLVEAAKGSADGLDVSSVMDNLPFPLNNIVSSEQVELYLSSSSENAVELAESVGSQVEETLIATVSDIISYIAIFLISFVVCTVAIIVLDGIFKLPVLNMINKAMGCLLGASYAYLFVSVAVCLASLIFGVDTIGGTLVTKIIYQIGLFTH